MRKAHQHPAPQLSFYNAMHREITLAPGKTVTVRECSEAVFVAMLTGILHRCPDEEALTHELDGLRFDDLVDRWYALNTLLKHGVAIT